MGDSAPDPMIGVAVENRAVRLPDLESWAARGIPGASGDPASAGCELWVAHRDSQTISSAWMVAGKLAQVAGDFVTSLAVTGQQPDPDRHWIAFGARDQIPAVLAEAAPLGILFRDGELMGRQGILAQFESPFRRGKAGGLVTAADRVLLEDRVAELIQEDLWGQLHGDAVVWLGVDGNSRFRRVSGSFEIGEAGVLRRAWRWLGGLPWLSLFFGMLGAGTIAWLMMHPVNDVDPETVEVTRRNGNRRMSRGRRLREAARRAARLERSPHSAG